MKLRNQLLILVAIGFVVFLAMQPAGAPRPNPDPTPGPSGSLRVMFLTDHAKPLTQEQTDAMSAADVLDYENSHCAKDGVRRFDVSETPDDLKNDTKFWREAFAKHGEAPSVTTFTKTRLGADKPTVHPFPKDVAGMLEILTKAGGK